MLDPAMAIQPGCKSCQTRIANTMHVKKGMHATLPVLTALPAPAVAKGDVVMAMLPYNANHWRKGSMHG